MSDLNQIIKELDDQIQELNELKNLAKLSKVQTFLQNEINRLTFAKQNKEKQLDQDDNEKKTQKAIINVDNYMWDQTDDYVKIYIELGKNEKIDNSDINLEFVSNTKIICTFGNYRFTLGRLYKPINVKTSKAVLTKSNRLVITLYKNNSGNWPSLQAVEPYFSDKDEPKLDDPEQSLMKMMKKMYDEGDDDMKRTIAKSWYESQQKQMSGAEKMFEP